MTVDQGTSTSTVKTTDTLGGVGVPAPATTDETARTRTAKRSKVSGKIAEVDYFLNGFVYATNELAAGQRVRGMRYYRFQFRLTDARSGLLVWENYYHVKLAGSLTSPPGSR